ncbi:MAG: PqqD family protein [Cyanobium sp. M30B3]|nr:MAG: PqqD family protein [Cyanobium sp. M30B3]
MANIRFADTARFPHDTIDGETVLIDSEKGHLFLFLGIGPQIWERLLTGASVDGLVNEVTARYGMAAAAPTRVFLDALEQAQMLHDGSSPSAAPATTSTAWPESFVAPTLERYDQIADIISMDPIHEVDPSKGWPHLPGEKA